MKPSSLFLPLIGVSALSVAAPETQLSPVLITSNGMSHTEFRAPFSAEIHHHHDIEKSGAINLYEYLKRFSSVTVMPSYGNPYTQLLDMRGFGAENGHQNIVITVNGRRLNNIDMTPQLLSSIPLESIERIEIIKGSGAVAQGDGAMAGTINIVTKNQTGGSVNLSAGSHGHSSASASLGISEALFAVQILAENARTDGLRDKDINGNKDNSDTNNLSASLQLFPTPSSELRLSKEQSWLDSTYGDTVSQLQFNHEPAQNNGKAYTNQKFSTDITRLGGSYHLAPAFKIMADHHIEKKTSEYLTPFVSLMDYDYRSTHLASEFNINRLAIVIGTQFFDGERDSGNSTTEKNNVGVYMQANYHFDGTVLSAGFRREEITYRHTDSTDKLKETHSLDAWELGINHQLNDTFSAFANLTSSFQAPDVDRFFATTYDPITWAPTGTDFNGFIQPAKNHTLNIGVNHFTEHSQLKAVLFYSKLSNEIYLDPLTFKNTNIDKSNKYGVELQERYQILDRLTLRANYTWVKAKIDQEDSAGGALNGNTMPGISEHSVSAGMEYQILTNGTLSINQSWRSRAYALNDFHNNFQQKQRAFNTTDLGYAQKFDQFTLYAQVDNLFAIKNGLWVADDAIYPINFTRIWYMGIRAAF